jgi:hypothetical protein
VSKNVKRLEGFFWLYLILNPILDIISGMYIRYITGGDVYSSASIAPVTPSLIIRMAVLLVMVAYIFIIRDWKSVKIAVPMGIAWALSVLSEFITCGEISIFIDIQYFARFAYNIAVFFVYCRLMERAGMTRKQVIRKFHQYVMISLFLLTVMIVIPFIFGVGYATYGDRFGFRGFRGFYYSGNDITAALMILFPIGTCYLLDLPRNGLKGKQYLLYALPLAMTLLSMLLIGTKTAFLAVGISGIALIIYAMVRFFKKDQEPFKRVACVILLFIFLYAAISAASQLVRGTSVGKTIEESLRGVEMAANEDPNGTLLWNGRMDKLIPAWEDYREGGILSWIFGVGRGSQLETIEMDICETLIYYGIFGLIAMLWLYMKEGISFIVRFFHRFTVLGFGAFLSLGLCVAYLTLAGHVLFTVTSGFYFAITLAYARYITGGDLPKGKHLKKK